jgi:hypothetical protein
MYLLGGTDCPHSVSECSVWFSQQTDCFPTQHYSVGLCRGDVMRFLWGTDCPHSVFVCSVQFSQQTATVSPHNINRLGSVVET